jgi:hypothetical protein
LLYRPEKYVEKANSGIGGAGYEKQILTGELLKNQNTIWIIPLIIHNKTENKTPIFLNGRKYISFEDPNFYETNYEELLRDILDEPILPIPPIGQNPFKVVQEFARQKFIPASEKYHSPSPFGIVTFDYSNNNGKYSIGQAELMFEIAFSKASDKCIYIYNDPNSIKAIAIANKRFETDTPIVMEFAFPAARGKLHAN